MFASSFFVSGLFAKSCLNETIVASQAKMLMEQVCFQKQNISSGALPNLNFLD
jgi:hypothetical protein